MICPDSGSDRKPGIACNLAHSVPGQELILCQSIVRIYRDIRILITIYFSLRSGIVGVGDVADVGLPGINITILLRNRNPLFVGIDGNAGAIYFEIISGGTEGNLTEQAPRIGSFCSDRSILDQNIMKVIRTLCISDQSSCGTGSVYCTVRQFTIRHIEFKA